MNQRKAKQIRRVAGQIMMERRMTAKPFDTTKRLNYHQLIKALKKDYYRKRRNGQ